MAFVSASGAKSSVEKPRYDLIEAAFLRRLAQRMAYGAERHGERNYRLGAADAVYRRDRINHLIEHALRYAAGDTSTDHLAAVAANANILAWFDDQAAAVPPSGQGDGDAGESVIGAEPV